MFNFKKKGLTAYILAGGNNSRIGMEKSLLEIEKIPIIELIIETLESVFPKIKIISAKKKLLSRFSQIEFIQDIYKHCGPLGGIHAALYDCDKAAFLIACDMPNINEELIENQVNLFLNNKYEALIPKHSQGLEPLHAIYHKNCLETVEQQLKRGNYSIRNFYRNVRVKYWQVADAKIEYFYNINSLKDYDQYCASH